MIKIIEFLKNKRIRRGCFKCNCISVGIELKYIKEIEK